MKPYYTANEAMKKLELPNSTFHYLVRKGDIPKLVLPLRKQAVYPKQEIDAIVDRKKQMLADIETSPGRLAFSIPTREEIEELIEMEHSCYHEETLIPIEAVLERLKYNPENIHILKDTKTNEVLGSITMSVLNDDTLKNLIDLEIDETQIKLEDYKPYTQGQSQDCYVVSIIAKPAIEEKYYASRLLTAIADYMISLLEQGITFRRIYTVATTQKGEELAKKLGFTLIKKGTNQHEDFRHSYVLNLEEPSRSKLVKKYIQGRKNIARRQKRHSQTANTK